MVDSCKRDKQPLTIGQIRVVTEVLVQEVVDLCKSDKQLFTIGQIRVVTKVVFEKNTYLSIS